MINLNVTLNYYVRFHASPRIAVFCVLTPNSASSSNVMIGMKFLYSSSSWARNLFVVSFTGHCFCILVGFLFCFLVVLHRSHVHFSIQRYEPTWSCLWTSAGFFYRLLRKLDLEFFSSTNVCSWLLMFPSHKVHYSASWGTTMPILGNLSKITASIQNLIYQLDQRSSKKFQPFPTKNSLMQYFWKTSRALFFVDNCKKMKQNQEAKIYEAQEKPILLNKPGENLIHGDTTLLNQRISLSFSVLSCSDLEGITGINEFGFKMVIIGTLVEEMQLGDLQIQSEAKVTKTNKKDRFVDLFLYFPNHKKAILLELKYLSLVYCKNLQLQNLSFGSNYKSTGE